MDTKFLLMTRPTNKYTTIQNIGNVIATAWRGHHEVTAKEKRTVMREETDQVIKATYDIGTPSHRQCGRAAPGYRVAAANRH